MRLPPIFNSTPCNTTEKFEKLEKVNFDYTLCADQCPFECSTLSYSLTTSYANYPSYNFYVSEMVEDPKYYQSLFKTPDVSFQTFSDGIGGIFIGFNELRYM